MRRAVTVDHLLAAAEAVSTTFEQIPTAPVTVRDARAIRAQESRQIVERYTRHGFAVMQLDPSVATPATLEAFADSLDLGAPFIPPLYANGNGVVSAVSRISAANADTSDAAHPSFGRSVGQALHCDGTLQPIGLIKASLLLCQSPGAEGGDTILFNSSAAYTQLVAVDVPAAAALATPGALIRQANINGCSDMNVGPAFTVQDGRLVCGYSVTETDRWSVPEGVIGTDVQRGVGFLMAAAMPGSPHFAQLRLAEGQAIIFDNTRISHGRTPYRDSETRRRCLFRSLHLRHPQVRVRQPFQAGLPGPERVAR